MDEDIIVLFIAPLILFTIFVAPIWLILHYKSKKQLNQGLTIEEQAGMRQLADKAEQMADRIDTLESILDSESPGWRNKV